VKIEKNKIKIVGKNRSFKLKLLYTRIGKVTKLGKWENDDKTKTKI